MKQTISEFNLSNTSAKFMECLESCWNFGRSNSVCPTIRMGKYAV